MAGPKANTEAMNHHIGKIFWHEGEESCQAALLERADWRLSKTLLAPKNLMLLHGCFVLMMHAAAVQGAIGRLLLSINRQGRRKLNQLILAFPNDIHLAIFQGQLKQCNNAAGHSLHSHGPAFCFRKSLFSKLDVLGYLYHVNTVFA